MYLHIFIVKCSLKYRSKLIAARGKDSFQWMRENDECSCVGDERNIQYHFIFTVANKRVFSRYVSQ